MFASGVWGAAREMHPNSSNGRRRKKRPNYGIRTVEVARGGSGFGFTISGQQPCILSCIVTNSPADLAGLRPGDFLISVNNVSVSKITHDAVVNLIGGSVGPIQMTIAENYYSDSSDEDVHLERVVNSRKPKYPHKPRMHRGYKYEAHKKLAKKEYSESFEEGACGMNISNNMEDEGGPIEYKAIVGYLGTIEMPKQLLPNARLQTVCGCIKKLRQEKRKPTTVLMTVLPTCLTLKNASNNILAIYPTNRVVYISSAMDKESRYFGLVTSAVCDRSLENVQKKCETSYTNVWDHERKCNNMEKGVVEVSNSCHVFVTDPKMVEHSVHAKKAESFRIACTNDVVTGNCLEFPRNALYIVSLVQNMYRLQSSVEPHRIVEDLVANSPQPSASSNSDSGIGFRDDCGNVSDRILVVEFPANRQLPILPNNNKRPINIIASNIPMESLDSPLLNNDLNNVRAKLKLNNADQDRHNLNNIRACENLSIKNAIEREYLVKQNNEPDEMGRLNCRAMLGRDVEFTDAPPYAERAIDVPPETEMEFRGSIDSISMHSSKSLDPVFKVPDLKKQRGKRVLVASCDSLTERYESSLLSYKLSPKVYGVPKPNHSCEKLNVLENYEKCGGSLQDLSSLCVQSQKKRFIAQSEPDVRLDRSVCMSGEIDFTSASENPEQWTQSFEKLLESRLGLHAFADFLRKEFSHENIYFWTACERFRRMPPGLERNAEAVRIYQQHLQNGGSETVNVDSQARQGVEQALDNVTANLFLPAQKQIFNLMKFDSYARFLKSEEFRQCQQLGEHQQRQFDPNLMLHPTHKLKKSLSNAEDRRRKSLLPWHRKNRSKSKDRIEAEFAKTKTDVNDNNLPKRNELHNSKGSLVSLDLAQAERHRQLDSDLKICKVNLFNGSTVWQIGREETIQEFVIRLLQKRRIEFKHFDVLRKRLMNEEVTGDNKQVLNLSDPSSTLAGYEVDVEQRVHFKVLLPNQKHISVRSKPQKLLKDIIATIMERYNCPVEDTQISMAGKPLSLDMPLTTVDDAQLTVTLNHKQNGYPEETKALEEITNKVYEDILQEKCDVNDRLGSDKGSVKSEDWGSEHSGLIGRFLKRDSERQRERKKKLQARSKGSSAQNSAEDVTADGTSVFGAQTQLTFNKPLIAKLKAGVKVQNTSESEELYEGLSRAQRSRLEDQRGTEINFELPDFLKDNENELARKKRIDSDVILPPKQECVAAPISAAKNLKLDLHSNYENQTLLTELGQQRLSYPAYQPTADVPLALKAQPESESPTRVEPPPLPPKPKVIPIKPSNWKMRDTRKGGLFLEQAASSFV